MSDSLRDQLKQAGFKETKPKARPKSKPKRSQPKGSHSAKTDATKLKAQQAEAERLARKAQKAAITELIDQHTVKDYAGDNVFSYTLEKKIRQLFVKQEARDKLVSGEWVITRLNGATHLVPKETGESILGINSQWLVVASSEQNNNSDGYDDFPVPDDLQW